MVDPDLVRRLQGVVGGRLHNEQERRATRGEPALVGEAQTQYTRKLIGDAIREHAASAIGLGQAPLENAAEQELASAIEARMYGAGRLQHLLDDDSIENINIYGCDEVFVVRGGSGERERVEAVAGSDAELIELIQTLGSYVGLNARNWSHKSPILMLRLSDGSRLSAVMSVGERPAISIRRSRSTNVRLADLVENKTMSDDVAQFMRAVIRARFNVMVAGATRAGKTHLLRALTAEIDPGERLIVIEGTRELNLKDSGNHNECVEWEAREPNTQGVGAVTMTELVRASKRQDPDRVIVGEVLGDEVIDMLGAMSQGNDGSLSTIHARSSDDVFAQIATYAIRAPERLPVEATGRLIASALDFVIFVSRDLRTGERRIESIREVEAYRNGVASNEVFAPGPNMHATWQGTLTDARRDRLEATDWSAPDYTSRWDR